MRIPVSWFFSSRMWFCLACVPVMQVEAAPFAYVSNSNSNNVSVLDSASNTVVATVAVGFQPAGLAVNAAGSKIYVANDGIGTVSSGSISVITAATNTVTATIPLSFNPHAVAVNAAATRLYAVGKQTGVFDLGGRVAVIDTATNMVITTLVEGHTPYGVAVSPDGSRVYVTDHSADPNPGAFTNNHVIVIDTATNTVTATIKLANANYATSPVVNAAGTRLYFAFQADTSSPNTYGALGVIDTANNQFLGDIKVGQLAEGVAISPDDKRVYVTTHFFNTLAAVDTRCNEKSATVMVLPSPGGQGRTDGVAVSPDGTRIFVAAADSNVKVIDAATLEIIDSVAVGAQPSAVAVKRNSGGGLPPVDPPVAAHITGIEITQGIQDLANSVPLMLFKRTFVRVYVEADSLPVEGVTATLNGLGSYSTAGGEVSVPLGALVPSNTGGPLIKVQPLPHRSNGSDGFWFELPWSWTAFKGLRLYATLSKPPAKPIPICASDLASAPVHEFNTYTELKVAYVRLSYQLPFQPPAAGGPTLKTTVEEQRRSESYMRTILPISKLSSTPDLPFFDGRLGAWVDRSDTLCQLTFLPEDRNKCAYTFMSSRLAALQVSSGFMEDADVAYGLIPQDPDDPEGVHFTRGACCRSGVIGLGAANNERTTSHEVGHFLGRKHQVKMSEECGHTPDDPDYPYLFTFIAPPLSSPDTALAGFDGGDDSLEVDRPVRFLAPGTTYDLMSYCQPDSWISDYNYKAAALKLEILHPDITAAGTDSPAVDVVQGAPQPGDWLLVFGHLASDLSAASIINIQRVDRVFSQPPRPPGPFSIRLLNDVSATLADYPFAPVAEEDLAAANGTGPDFGFGHVVPFIAGTREVQIINTEQANAVLASVPVSVHAPEVSNVLAQGPPNPVTGLMPVTWNASDSDGDALTFDLFFTRDDGATLKPLELGLTELSSVIDTKALGGGNTRIRVVASDGVLSAYDDSGIVVLPNKSPLPRILSPGDGAEVYLGQIINLEGEASDAQDGQIDPATLAWSSELGPLGSGGRLTISDLPAGVHLLTLEATNSLALTATRSISVKVNGNITTHGPTLTAGPGQIGWHVVTGEMALQTAELYVGNSGSGNLQFTAISNAPWLMLSASGGTAPKTLTLTANPAGFVEGQSIDTTVILTAVASPNQEIVIPVRIGVGNTFVVGDAYKIPPPNLIFHNGFESLP